MIWNHVWSQKVISKHSTDVMKFIWRKSMSINDIFVGHQACKQAHTHAKLCYCNILLFKAQTDVCHTVQSWPNQFQTEEGTPRLVINSSSISHPPSAMSLRTVTHRNMSTTRLYRCYRGKTNSYRGENFYWYIANDKSLLVPVWEHQWCVFEGYMVWCFWSHSPGLDQTPRISSDRFLSGSPACESTKNIIHVRFWKNLPNNRTRCALRQDTAGKTSVFSCSGQF